MQIVQPRLHGQSVGISLLENNNRSTVLRRIRRGKGDSLRFLFLWSNFMIGIHRALRPRIIEIALLHDGARVSLTPITICQAWRAREGNPAMNNALKSPLLNNFMSKRGRNWSQTNPQITWSPNLVTFKILNHHTVWFTSSKFGAEKFIRTRSLGTEAIGFGRDSHFGILFCR